MRKLLTTMVVLLSVVVLAQKPKYIIVKNYREGKLTAQKKIVIDIQWPKVPKTIYKTKIKTVVKIVEVPKIEYKIVEVAGKPTALDTVSILQAYYPKNTFKDVLVLPDGQGRITISDTISHNRLASRKWIADITPKVVKETVEVPAPAIYQYYLGPEITTNFNGVNNWYGLNLLVKDKRNNIVKMGGGINMRDGLAGPQPYMSVGLFFNIK